MRQLLPVIGAGAVLAAAALPPLDVYIDKEPFENVRGVSFFKHPAVREAVAAVVPSAPLRAMMLAPTGPSGPVVATGAAVKADGCEAHNCGDHNWTIEIDRATLAARVCYHDAATMGPRSRWFLAAGLAEMRAGSCL